MTEGLTRVSHVDVSGLFGLYNHSIDFRLDDRVTIIHGPNGVGKTVLLKLLSAIFSGKYFDLSLVPFNRLAVRLDDGSELTFESSVGHRRGVEAPGARQPLNIALLRNDLALESFRFQLAPDKAQYLAGIIDSNTPWLTRVGSDLWVDDRTGQSFSAADLVAAMSDRIPAGMKEEAAWEPEWLRTFRKSVSVHLIETQRLLRIPRIIERAYIAHRRDVAVTSTVKNYASELQDLVSGTLAQYASRSQQLDQSFPQRLLSGSMVSFNTDELKAQMRDLDKKRSGLSQIGLLSETLTYPFDVERLDNLDSTQRTVMTLYVTDTAHKLQVLDDLARRIALLVNIVNDKFRHKKIGVARDQGLTASGDDGTPLDLDALSSGEQHELILAYDLLFRVSRNSLVMIDEPELSLHVTWQKSFLPDLLSIVQATQFDVLLATHSPFIVGDRTDLMVPLSSESEGAWVLQ